jgi:CHAT domain-containing protein/tetratricopeptide (TPR) repeat protein
MRIVVRSLGLAAACALGAHYHAQEPAVLAPGALEADLGEPDRGTDGVYRRPYFYRVTGPCTVYVRADSETLDPTLTGGLRGGNAAKSHTGVGGKISACLTVEVANPGEQVFELMLEGPQEGRVQLALSLAQESPECAEAVRAAEEALAKHGELLRTGNRAGAQAALAGAAEGLFALDLAETSGPAAVLLDRIGSAAFDARVPGLSYEARLRVLAYFEHHYPERHADLQMRRLRFALACDLGGEPARGIPALELALAAVEIAAPPDQELSFAIAERLGIALSRVGRIQEARACIEALVLELERSSHHQAGNYLRNARSNLAVTLYQMGDLAAARTRYEELLADSGNSLPPDKLLGIQGNLAMVLADMGQTEDAAALQAQVLEGFEAIQGNLQDIDRARSNLAASFLGLGRLDEARCLLDQVLARAELGPDDPLRLVVQFELAVAQAGAGDLPGAQVQLQDVLARRERTLDPDHPHLHGTRMMLAQVFFELGDRRALENQLQAVLPALRRRIAGAAGLGRRERGDLAHQVASSLRDLHVLARGTGIEPELVRELFGITESLRALAALSPRIPDDAELDEELRGLRSAWHEASVRLVDQLDEAGGTASDEALAETEREAAAAERAYRRALAERNWLPSPEVTVDGVARRLAEGCAVVAYRRLGLGKDPLPRAGLDQAGDDLIASVVLPDGRYRLVWLGDTRAVGALVAAWRAAIGRPIAGATTAGDRGAEARAGRELRALVLDPVLAAVDGADELRVCLDDVLHLVPLDALPAGEEGSDVVGDRVRILVLPSLAGAGAPPRRAAQIWVGVGAVDYGEADLPSSRGYETLPGTEGEVRAIATALAGRPGFRATLLLGSDATSERVRLAAEGASHLHIATHGFFEDEGVLTWDDPLPRAMAHRDPRFAVTGLAPLAACGLALAGANRGRSGVLLAEQLATWNLSGLELAVLSACETGVGLRRSGQGVSSLQAALHAAGARAVVASLWRMDDASTARILKRFYELANTDAGLDPALALARAKSELRAERRPTRDWAGWLVTTGGS